MTAAQWDAPLRAKVATGWNLHNATLDDSLDFFILFSSVVSMTGNRTQASYATGNSFLNRLAAERRASGRTGVSVAVPAMSGIGVLADNESLLACFDTAGLAAGGEHELESFMEAAVRESHRPDGRSFIGMGLQMFATVDGALQTRPSQNQVFWADFAEFGCLMDHRRELSGCGGPENRHLGEQLRAAEEDEAHRLLLGQFLPCLANVLGYKLEALDPSSSIAAYGLGSLNAVACRYWFFKEVSVDVAVFDILGCRSINELVTRVISKLKDEAGAAKATVSLPEPCQLPENSLRPLSQSQRRLWLLHKFLADKTVYNLLLICHVEGTVQDNLLEQAWQTLFDRHEVLRSRIVDTPDGLQQLPVHGYKFHLDVVECSDVDYATKMELFKSPSSAALFLASHHLAWDRSSVKVVFDEVTTIYQSLADGKAPDASLEPVDFQFVDFQFVDFTHWQNQWLSMDAFKDPLITYWREQLEGIPESVSLLPLVHTDRRPIIKQHVTGTTSLTLDSALGRRIKSFCASHALTPFMLMTAAVAALVGRLTGDRDVVVGITDGDRGHSAFDRLVGFSINMLPIRCRIDPEGDMSILDLLEQFRTSCLQAYEHRALPFDLLLQNLPGLPRRTAHGPVFQIMVNYQMHGSFAPVEFGNDFRFARYDHFNARNETDFTLDVEEAPDASLRCVFEFDTALYRASPMDEFARIYSTFVSQIVDCDDQLEFNAVPLVSADDEALIAAVYLVWVSFCCNKEHNILTHQSIITNANTVA
ncbi:polyketide synthase [Fusarium albosuccineum]|uniref:Polyketide synthase n=1 Tax=Fusarium albosuccineum TaxID=1237068 RepID=A0A8H4L4B3_9HYPO|nr:polyketide synthase [Fusarium albosuccineum]